MKKQTVILTAIILVLFISGILSACSSYFNGNEVDRVGMLVEHSIHDQSWGSKGYQGLLDISDSLDVDVYFQEGINTQQQVNRAVEEFANKDINLIIGHSNIYGKMFHQIREAYPDIHFLYVNGGYFDDNLTSINFNSLAMGFFGGMVAGEMTETNHIGLIAAFEWQPEIEGFYEGAVYQNPDVNVNMKLTNSWDDTERAMEMYNQMQAEDVDVYYPAGDSFSVPIIEEVKKDGDYSIGFVSDQSEIGGRSVLTSTVQHVDKLYLLAAKQFNNNELPGAIINYGFAEDVITMGEYSEDLSDSFKKELDEAIETYIETGLLPNQLE